MLKGLKILLVNAVFSGVHYTNQLMADEKYTANECFEKLAGELSNSIRAWTKLFLNQSQKVIELYLYQYVPEHQILPLRSLLTLSNNIQNILKGNNFVSNFWVFLILLLKWVLKKSREDFGLGVWGANRNFVLLQGRDALGLVEIVY